MFGIRSITYLSAALLLCFLLAGNAAAQDNRSDVYVPPDLAPWQDWVLHGREFLSCPFFFDDWEADPSRFVCAWPGALALAVTGNGGRFTQSWSVYAAEQWVPLPGDGRLWPEQVTVDGRAIEVILRDGAPMLRLAPGRHALTGRFAWAERPSTLNIPGQTGLVTLTVDGVVVPRPDRNDRGLWLGEPEVEETTEDSIEVQVYRLVADDVPTRLVTAVQFLVSGSVREEVLGPALPDGFTPLDLGSELPARLEPDGNLRVQVRPGNWVIRIVGRAGGVLDSVAMPTDTTNLPDTEIWSYRSNDRLRITAAEGLPAVDPLQVAVPGQWAELPAFRISGGESLAIVERNRGRASTDNQLELDRRMWLDFNGAGFAVSDTIYGEMKSDWRLDMAEPFEVHAAREDDENLLVTVGAEPGQTGVELRNAEVLLEGIGRSETRAAMPVAGWQARFNSIDVQLNLPPGNKLLAAIGADQSPGSWVDRWQLLDFFLVLITTIATLKLFGRGAAAIAFAGLTLSWHELAAPQWIWLNLLVAVALARVAPQGRLLRIATLYRAASVVALAVIIVPFVAEQVRIGIFPQLESQASRGYYSYQPRRGAMMEVAAPNAAPVAQQDMVMLRTAPDDAATIEEIVVTGARRSFARYAPNAVVQAGPSLPDWQWNTYRLSWGGPVEPDRSLRLVILPSWLVSGLRFIHVLLILGFSALFVLEVLNRRWQWPTRVVSKGASSAVVLMLAMGATLAVPDRAAHADTPSSDLLRQLEQRLLEPPPCAPACAEIVAADVTVTGDELEMALQVHALDNVAVSLPGSLGGWRPEVVRVDGGAAPHVYRRADGGLWVEASGGRHRVTLAGPLPPVDSISIPFPARPRVIDVAADGWFVAGIQDRRLTSGSLQLTRLQDEGAGDTAARWERNRFPTFVRVERVVNLGLDWSVSTLVTRIAPQQGALTIDVPLLQGESVLAEDLEVSDGQITVSMNPDQRTVSWDSTLPRTTPLTLTAPDDAPWKDVWRFSISHVWRATFNGVPESEPANDFYGARVAEFYPRAGEALTLSVTRPEATSGGTIAFDSVDMTVDVGARSRDTNLSLEYRATRGAQHVIRLPADAELTAVMLDGRTSPLRAQDGDLSLPILPGEHVISLRWREATEVGWREVTPEIDLGAPSGNIELTLNLPQNRWILATSGPRQGPAILYWSELVAMILFALILGRIPLTPLKTHHWVLLGLGFSTFSWGVLMYVAVWLLATGSRGKWDGDVRWWRFDLVQIAFAMVTISALLAILVSVPQGLLGSPDMQVSGYGSFRNSLSWFADRSTATLPDAAAISVPLWIYKALILAWALWLSFALLRWLPWVWQCFNANGLWKARPKKTAKAD